MKNLALAALTILAVSACAVETDTIVKREKLPMSASQVQMVKTTIGRGLKDPRSAQYQNIRMVRNTNQSGTSHTLVCGEVNAKNSYGAYVGFKMFVGRFQGKGFTVYNRNAAYCG